MPAGQTKRCTITVQSEPSAVVEVCNRILPELERNGYTKEDVFAVHLAVEEAFINAVKHGNKMDPSKKVVVDYTVDPEKVEISMTDEGGGFNPEAVPDPRFGKNLFQPNGRGLLLMRAYMDVVQYNEQGNTVHMVRYKERPRITKSPGETQG